MNKKMCVKYVFLLLLLSAFFAPKSAMAVHQHNPGVKVRQCLRCHPLAYPTHRLYIMDRSKIPAGWPLAKNGRMTCLTCHDCENGTCKLRKQGQALCMTCHDGKKGMALQIGIAHMGNSKGMNAIVSYCRACHNGKRGPMIGDYADEHPDNIAYLGSGLNPTPNRHILIINGEVTCLSCHDPYNSRKYKLSYSNWANVDNLCTECHIDFKNHKYMNAGKGTKNEGGSRV